jgi:superfamily II DNA or RNA helicase
MGVTLTEKWFAEIAGWQAMKEARGLLAAGKVRQSDWSPPLLKGRVQSGSRTLSAGLLIRASDDVENLCACREARQWGTMCAHSVAVGLHHLQARAAPPPEKKAAPTAAKSASAPSAPDRPAGRRIRRAGENEAGEPARIALILPPNFAATLAGGGRVTLSCEAIGNGARRPLNALPAQTAFRFSPADAALLDALEALADGDTPAVLRLDSGQFAALLPRLTGEGRVSLGRATPVRVSETPWLPPLRATLESDGAITLALKTGAPSPDWLGAGWVFHDAVFQPTLAGERLAALTRGPVRLRRAEVPEFLTREWPLLAAAGTVEANFRPDDFTLSPQPPRFLLHLTGALTRLEARLQCAYGPRVLAAGEAGPEAADWMPDPEAPTRYWRRDRAAEAAAAEQLRRAGFGPPNARGRMELHGEHRVLNFFARELPRLERTWQVSIEPRLEGVTRKIERIEPRVEITSSGTRWFDLDVAFVAPGGERIPPAELQRLLRGGQSHVRLRDGRRALLDTGAVEEFQELLRDCAPEQHAGRYRLARTQAGFVEATLREQGWAVRAPADWRSSTGVVRRECPPLGPLEKVLRPYQKEGVAWLRWLRENRFGGILADEMGLGKTLQVLALLDALRRTEGPRPPTLVVCPTSLVFNWEAEARRFTPELRVLTLHGPDRHKRFADLPACDLALTSYALIRRDLRRYRRFEFDTVVLDEAQHIKNRRTENARAVKAIPTSHRLVLTGTPLENSVLDLWSIFDFLMPGYLGSAREFRERYEQPLTRAPDAALQARLSRRVRPFLLRRRKADVAAELPERLEQVAYCELTPAQRRLYQQILEAGRAEVLNAAESSAGGPARMAALNALLRLRQVCCDPRLLPLKTPSPAGADAPPSGKLELFNELLAEVLDGGHRVLVFSQFVRMLTLLRETLDAQDVPYCYLDGATANRPEVIARFQSGAAPVFLISLKAGGVGLNLTAADTVMHFDPWWNPAVEDQATDRAHRLGQTRRVTSYQLITRGTVEEKILALQRRKRELIQATLGGEEQLVSALSWEEIRSLFTPDPSPPE